MPSPLHFNNIKNNYGDINLISYPCGSTDNISIPLAGNQNSGFDTAVSILFDTENFIAQTKAIVRNFDKYKNTIKEDSYLDNRSNSVKNKDYSYTFNGATYDKSKISPKFIEEIEKAAKKYGYDPQYLISKVIEYSNQNGIDPNIVLAVMKQESRFNPNDKSWAGAKGLMQLMDCHLKKGENSYNIDTNLRIGIKFLADMLKQSNGNLNHALWKYNAGPGNFAKGIKPKETQDYIAIINNTLNNYC